MIFFFNFILGFDTIKSANIRMAYQQPSTTVNDQSRAIQIGSSSNEIFRPTAVSDVPELSKENLLTMLK
jgi:hypothetical protein